MNDHHNLSNWLGNIFATGTIVATLAGWVPVVGALIAASWYLIQIYESATVQRWLAARRARKIARLKARLILMEAQQLPPLPGPFDDDAPKHH